MPFVEGDPNINRSGRPKGATNKTSNEIREAYQKLVEDNLENMTLWLMQVAEQNPEKATQLMLQLSEYIIPKLARQEITGSEGQDLFKNIKFQFGPDINDTENRIQE